MSARHIIDNITASLVIFLKRPVFEIYNMSLEDVIYTYSVIYIDAYNMNAKMASSKGRK